MMNIINFIDGVLIKNSFHLEQIDLYITSTVKNHKLNISYLKNNYFDNILEYDSEMNSSIIEDVTKYLFIKHSFKKRISPYSFELPTYDYLIATGYSNIFVRLCNIERKANVILLEDGMATYINDEINLMKKSKIKQLMKLLKLGPLNLKICLGYSYYPELIQYQTDYRIERLPLPSDDTIKNCKNIFNYSYNEIYRNYKMIYLTNSDFFTDNYGFEEEEFFKRIFSNVNSVLVRLHPKRDSWKCFDSVIDDKNEMWELQCGSLTTDNVLISVFSTAMITPFLIYGKSCKLVFLYRLLYKKTDLLYQYAESFLCRFKDIYPKEIYMPETFDQAKDLIDYIDREKFYKLDSR